MREKKTREFAFISLIEEGIAFTSIKLCNFCNIEKFFFYCSQYTFLFFSSFLLFLTFRSLKYPNDLPTFVSLLKAQTFARYWIKSRIKLKNKQKHHNNKLFQSKIILNNISLSLFGGPNIWFIDL